MKKLVLVLVLMASFTGMTAQNKTQEKKIKYFVEAAVKEFSLNADQHKQLLDARNAYITDYMKVSKSAEGDDKKAKLNEVNKSFNQVLSEITGKTFSELQPFLARMRDELQNV